MAKKKINISNPKYRVTVLNDDSLEELKTVRLTKFNVFTYGGIAVFIIAVFIIFLLIYTPLNVLVPKHSSSGVQSEIVANSLKIDTLEEKIATEKKYLSRIKNILQGKTPVDTFKAEEIFEEKGVKSQELNFNTSELDSILRKQIEEAENQSLSKIENVNTSANLKNLHFVVPLKGMVSDEFDIKIGHLGIDIVPGTGDAVLATLPGTVVLAAWSLETGYVIEIQHDNDLISFYKHNSVLLKKSGDRVVAGESIAIVGNSGEETTGPHLHFELWIDGTPVNPRDYITF